MIERREIVDPPAAPDVRRQDIELLRLVSAFGIVCDHSSGRDNDIAYAALIVFLMLSVYLGGRSGGADWGTVQRRARRLLVPWLVWWVVYGVFNALRGKPIFPTGHGVVAGILAGTSIHLWYMPFMFICLITLDTAKTWLSGPTLAAMSGLSALAMLTSVPVWRPMSIAMGYPMAQWLNALTAVFIGAFVLYAERLPVLAARLLAAAIFCAALYRIPFHAIGWPYALAMAFLMLINARHWSAGWTVRFDTLSQYTMGIYFAHILILSILGKLGLAHPVLLPLAGFLLSASLVAALRRAAPRLATYWS